MNPQHLKQHLTDYALEFAHFLLSKSKNFVPFSAMVDGAGSVSRLGGHTGRYTVNAKDIAALVMKELWEQMSADPEAAGVVVYNGTAKQDEHRIDAIFMIYVFADGSTEKTYFPYTANALGRAVTT
ncbi:MAG: hypothetical protein H0W83_09220 [Planctomycetes bacterium]|nr:hypothetical protein [Planctomycetota bacterium]